VLVAGIVAAAATDGARSIEVEIGPYGESQVRVRQDDGEDERDEGDATEEVRREERRPAAHSRESAAAGQSAAALLDHRV
jgi:hypothetical protein